MKTAQPFVPFVRSNTDADNLDSFYPDAPFCRMALDKPKFAAKVGVKFPLWLDVGFDGAPAAFVAKPSADWVAYINKHGDVSCIADDAFMKNPTKGPLTGPVHGFLDEACALNPFFLSVPQLPHVDGIGNNKVNRLLAAIASDWRNDRKPTARFILPVVFTNQRQLNKKTERNAKIAFVKSLVSREGYDAVWATDASLDDQAGTGTFDKERFPGVIDFFKELNAACALPTLVAGPFWGLGLVLWARGLATHFGIGLGSAYRYYTPGVIVHGAKARVAIDPLRRWASSSVDLQDWLAQAQAALPTGSPEQKELKEIEKHFPALLSQEIAKRQVARFYRGWIDRFTKIPPAGRAVALFQDVSAAFVTGKSLPDIKGEDGPARRPEKIAEQLMLNCL